MHLAVKLAGGFSPSCNGNCGGLARHSSSHRLSAGAHATEGQGTRFVCVCNLHSLRAKEAHTIHAIHTLTPGPTWQCWNAWLTRHAIPIRPHTLLHNPFPMCRRFRRPTNLSISKQLSLSSLSAQRRTAAGRDPPGLPSPLRLRCPAFPSPLPSQLS